jgi:hypothetical protein
MKRQKSCGPRLGKLVHQLPGVVTFAYDLRFRRVIARWKGIVEEIHFGGSIMPSAIIENLYLEKPSFGPSKWPRKLKPAKNSKLPKWPENCFEPFGKGGWPPISTWISCHLIRTFHSAYQVHFALITIIALMMLCQPISLFSTLMFLRKLSGISSFKAFLTVFPRFQIAPSSALHKMLFSDMCYGICCRLDREGELEVRPIAGGFAQAQAYQLLSHSLQVLHELFKPC